MANSTHVITDCNTLAGTAFSAASLTKAKSASGDNIDIAGMAISATAHAANLKNVLTLIANACDAGDAQLTLTNNILGTLS